MGHAANINFYEAGNKGIMSWLITLDHKRIGLMYFITTMMSLCIGGIFALLVRLELMFPGQQFFDPNTYNRLFTLHGAVMVFWFIIPAIPGALGNFFLPLMIGAKDVAFPRLNLLSYYLLLLGMAINLYGILHGPGADTGWTFYTPYSIKTGAAVVSMVVGVFFMGFASILTGLNFIVTVHTLRCPGLTWFRLPLFVWAIYSTSILQVLATPVIGITLILLTLERTLGIGFFDPKLGGDPVLFQHFFWFYSHPAVYIMILPAMGIISEVIPTMSQKTIFGYRAIAYSSLGLGLVSFLVWGHHMFTSGQSELANFVFSLLTMATAVPSAIKMFNWVATMYKGSISLATPMLYAIGFLFTFGIGGITGIMLGVLSADMHFHDTYFVVAHFHYVMMGGAAIALFSGIFYWFPKMLGRMYNEFLGKLSFWFFIVGFNVTFLAQFVAGLNGMPRRYHDYDSVYAGWNLISTVGSWGIALGILMIIINVVYSSFKGPKAPANPWKGKTLEWAAESPPVLENFEKTPTVTSGPYDYGLKA
ncbi:MAG: cytochrome c oxidase subunit I [Oligoflexia bacterium]|nr:cytochrome c oxidase subunit I [Oligoflexia bacterium]